jgi:hypothetical protein
MLMSTIPDPRERPGASAKRDVILEPNFDRPSKPIADFAARPDFPQCAYGEFVDMGGYAGVVVEIVNQSMKVRSPEGATQSFNIHVLRRLYAPPPPEPQPFETGRTERPLVPATPEIETPALPPKREVITEANFDRSPKPISSVAGRHDFPKCALGELVEIAGYIGVVVEIAKESLKVKSPQGIIRSYGVSTLRKLYGQR